MAIYMDPEAPDGNIHGGSMNTICEEHLDIIHVQEACNVCRPYAKSQGAWSSSWPCMAMHGKATTTTNNKTSRNKHQQSLSPAPTYHNQRHHRCTKSPSNADPATPPPRSSRTTHKHACLCPTTLYCAHPLPTIYPHTQATCELFFTEV